MTDTPFTETGWQPIATAPAKRLVLVALIDGEVIHRVSDARNSGLGWFTRNGGVSCHWATHWAPMPPWWPNGVPAEETLQTVQGIRDTPPVTPCACGENEGCSECRRIENPPHGPVSERFMRQHYGAKR